MTRDGKRSAADAGGPPRLDGRDDAGPGAPRARGGREALLAFAAYAAVFAVCGLPWLRAAAGATPSATVDTTDQWLVVWILTWVAHALRFDPRHLFDAPINHPAPAQLAGIEHLGSAQLVFSPLYALTGNGLLAANLTAWLSYPLAGLAMDRLLRRLGVGRLVAWTSGLLFALGPLRVPANLLVLKYANLYLPWTALALTRLRRQPTPGAAGVLALALGLALFSSYYMAVLVVIAAGLWGLCELVGRGPGRLRFVAIAAMATALPGLLLVIASQPYLVRSGTTVLHVSTEADWYFALGRLRESGRVTQAVAAACVLAVAAGTARARQLATRGLLLAATGLVLMLGPGQSVFGRQVPLPFALLAASPAGFFRYPYRFIVVVGFGTALLTAAGLETVAARVGRRAGLVAAAGVIGLALTTRGAGLIGHRIELGPVVATLEECRGQTAPAYDWVRRTAAVQGPGPLLELPTNPYIAIGAMVGSTRHWQPLVAGFSDYQPPHRWFVDQAITALPAIEALDDLIDMTHVRWILLHPAEEWPKPRDRYEMATNLVAQTGITNVFERAGWRLLRVDRRGSHDGWYASIAAGPRPGLSALGTRPVPVKFADASARVSAPTMPEGMRKDWFRAVELSVLNASSFGWVAYTPWGPDTYTIRLYAEWRPVGAPAGSNPVKEQDLDLSRDLPAGEGITQRVILWTPTEAGMYALEIGFQQVGGRRFGLPLHAQVEVFTPEPVVELEGPPAPENAPEAPAAAPESPIAPPEG